MNQIFKDIENANKWITEQKTILTPFSTELLLYVAPKMIRQYGSIESSFLMGLHLASGQIAQNYNIDPTVPIQLDSPEEDKLIFFGDSLIRALGENPELKNRIMKNTETWSTWTNLYDLGKSDPGMKQ